MTNGQFIALVLAIATGVAIGDRIIGPAISNFKYWWMLRKWHRRHPEREAGIAKSRPGYYA